MTNQQIAAIFEKISSILEIKGDNPFRIRSFQRAAQILQDLSFDVSEAHQSDPQRLKGIPGIGAGTLSKIDEILATGSCAELDRLTSEIPVTLLDLLKLQHLGPKKISLFWKKLDITNLDQLEEAARDERLRQLPGMGALSEQKILESIGAYRKRTGRSRLDHAIEVSEILLEHLKKQAPVERVAVAGSVRRRRETIGDLDILATSTTPERVMDAFVSHPAVAEVTAQGPTKTSVRLQMGLSCDLRVVEDDSFGAAMQYFTGSKQHNVVLRERAKRMGLKISEYGLFRVEDDAKIAGRDEADIYRHLGLQMIPPELRENRGEIEAAENEDGLPELIEIGQIMGDLHLHTTASDGKHSLPEMADAARGLGYEYIAVTDHSKALAMIGGLDEEKLMQQVEEIRQFNDGTPGIVVLAGVEVDILEDGSLDLDDQTLSQLDIVIASVHSHMTLSGEAMTARICRALEHPLVNILGHPTGRILQRRDAYSVDLDQIIQTARENGVSLEINAHPKRLDLRDIDCRNASDQGVRISINSDAHSTAALTRMRFGIDTARRGWLGPKNVINTLPLAELKKVLAKGKS